MNSYILYDLFDLSFSYSYRYKLNEGLYQVCLKGRQDLANLMIEKGAYEYSLALYGACQNGHIDLAKWLTTSEVCDCSWTSRYIIEKEKHGEIDHLSL